jgi:hypothetical protein
MCADCKAELARAQDNLEKMTSERDQLLVMLSAAMDVVTPEQFAAMRARIGERDADGAAPYRGS